jgi:glycosyltransferase involved in cell wall biosynthesis
MWLTTSPPVREPCHMGAWSSPAQDGGAYSQPQFRFHPTRHSHKPRVVVVYKSLPHYRVTFFESLRAELERSSIQFDLIYGNAVGDEALKSDTEPLSWGSYTPNHVIRVGDRALLLQPVLGQLRAADLVIVEQASRLLLNYVLLIGQRLGGPRVSMWGHGRNLQAHRASRPAEFAKRRVSTWPHWWFAYTERTRQIIEELGFPRDRITVVQNATDTHALMRDVEQLAEADLQQFRKEHALKPTRTCIFLGSLYPEKRLTYLISAADELVRQLPGFRLLIAGDGPDRQKVDKAVRQRKHVVFLGRITGGRKALALRASDLMLMPGLVGLALLDSFASETPLLTTAIDFHSPEIEYLIPGKNGACLSKDATASEYAEQAVSLLSDPNRLSRLQQGCREAAQQYTNEAMVARFAAGVHSALVRRI